ncbi:MAG: hypothetical protein JXB07_14420 [Anaerolineae bacterium]|nr:hypothetical protein [Anaerolineae bacterium]
MVKKIVLGSLLVGFIGVLVYGAILRTDAKTSSGGLDGHGAGDGLGRGRADTTEMTDAAVGRGQGQGQNQTARADHERQAGAQSERVADWQTVEGTIISVGSKAMVVELVDGRQLLVEGQPWLYAQTQVFSPQVGHQLVMEIFEEDDELKPGRIDNLSNGETVTLRLEDGQPMWARGLQNDRSLANGQGQGQGQGQGNDQGQGTGRGQGNASGEQTGAALSNADELTYQGIAVTVNNTEMVIEAGANELVLVEGRAWAYALEQGMDAQVGHTILIMGFVEDGEFKAISLENLTTGQHIAVRDASGRPLWSGGRRGGA